MCEGSGDEDDMWLLVVVNKDVDEGSHQRGLGFAGVLVVLARRRVRAIVELAAERYGVGRGVDGDEGFGGGWLFCWTKRVMWWRWCYGV